MPRVNAKIYHLTILVMRTTEYSVITQYSTLYYGLVDSVLLPKVPQRQVKSYHELDPDFKTVTTDEHYEKGKTLSMSCH